MTNLQFKIFVAIANFFLCVVFGGGALFVPEAIASEKLPELPLEKEIERIKNGLYPFNTIQFEYTRYISLVGNAIEAKLETSEEKGTLFWDRRKNAYCFREIQRRGKDILDLSETILLKGRVHEISREFKEGARLMPVGPPVDPSYLGAYNESWKRPFSLFQLFRAWELSHSSWDPDAKTIYNLFEGKKITQSNFVKKGKEIVLNYEDFSFTFDSLTGRLLSQNIIYTMNDAGEKHEVITELSEYETINGVPFPLCIKFIDKEKNRMTVNRYQIDKKTLRINEKIPQEKFKFSFSIPKGMMISNRTEGTWFRSTGTDGSIPVEDVAKELDDIYEEAERLR